MTKQAEKDYLKNIGKEGTEHALNKPFSDPKCAHFLMELGAILSLLPPPPASLLDLGCGTGWTSCFFAKRGYKVTGQDIASDMICLANLNKDKQQLDNLNFIESDYDSLDYDNEFDCALFYTSLHHAENEDNVLRSVYKALKPGGICITTEPGKGHSRSKEAIEASRDWGTTEKDMPPGRIIKAAKKAGFKKYKVFPHATVLTTTIYAQPRQNILRELFRFDIFRILATVFYIIAYKGRSGIVMLVK